MKSIPFFAIFFLALTLANAAQAQVGRSQGLLDANCAPENQLAALPHLNDDLAKQIVEQRPFASITNLHALLLSKSRQPEQLRGTVWKTLRSHQP
ncbi:MAG: helix-hairpin-helix domain-containing protein [Verrucomicrobia bacterium]|nr:helix-hairpin-helix domain-containing protein [Verrucomicrobiota bacterium]